MITDRAINAGARNTLDGLWFRGQLGAHVEDAGTEFGPIPVVVLDGPAVIYRFHDRRRESVQALLTIAASSDMRDVTEFARQFGPLVERFDDWVASRMSPEWWGQIAEVPPETFVDKATFGVQTIDTPTDPDLRATLRLFSGAVSPGLVLADFVQWCRENGHRSAALYAVSLGQQFGRDRSLTRPTIPVAFYVWAARRLAEITEQLKGLTDGDLVSLDAHLSNWLRSQLAETHLYLGGARGQSLWFGVTATSLLALVTAHAVLAAKGYQAKQRTCRECGASFFPMNGKQIYCGDGCSSRVRQRRHVAKQTATQR